MCYQRGDLAGYYRVENSARRCKTNPDLATIQTFDLDPSHHKQRHASTVMPAQDKHGQTHCSVFWILHYDGFDGMIFPHIQQVTQSDILLLTGIRLECTTAEQKLRFLQNNLVYNAHLTHEFITVIVEWSPCVNACKSTRGVFNACSWQDVQLLP